MALEVVGLIPIAHPMKKALAYASAFSVISARRRVMLLRSDIRASPSGIRRASVAHTCSVSVVHSCSVIRFASVVRRYTMLTSRACVAEIFLFSAIDKAAALCYNLSVILRGRVKFPTGGTVRERVCAESVQFRYRQLQSG